MNAAIGELVEAGSTNATQLITTNSEGTVKSSSYQTHFVKVVSGTVKLGVNGVHADAHGWTSSDVIPPITCLNGELYFMAAANTDTFVVTV
jgi:hypothetical protein